MFLTDFIFYDYQYGFRPKHSTNHPIIHLLYHCASSSSKHDPETTLVILCDLSKASDVIDYAILLTGLNMISQADSSMLILMSNIAYGSNTDRGTTRLNFGTITLFIVCKQYYKFMSWHDLVVCRRYRLNYLELESERTFY